MDFSLFHKNALCYHQGGCLLLFKIENTQLTDNVRDIRAFLLPDKVYLASTVVEVTCDLVESSMEDVYCVEFDHTVVFSLPHWSTEVGKNAYFSGVLP